jgi:hypothetical protein
MGSGTGLRVALGALACAALVLVGGTAPAGGESVKVRRAIPFAEGSGATSNVKSECQLETRVPAFLSEFSDAVELVDGDPGRRGRVLELSITNVIAPGGGAWSGAKMLTVKGQLRENGKAVGSFTATRYSGGGVFGAYKGTCAIVARCAKTIGRDIAEWLRNPQDGARLGDA